jgi:hypothetical protein
MTRAGRAVISRAVSAIIALGLLALTPGPAPAHHVGVWTPRDNEISTNFKQLKFALQAGRFDAALPLYQAGPLRRELQARAGRLPPGLDEDIRAALQAGDARAAERGLMVFFVALTRDLAREADRQLADGARPREARLASGRKFLEAIWRYYSLVDFAVTQHDPKAAIAVRLAFDDAESQARAAPAGDPDRLRGPLQQIVRVLTGVIEASSTSARRDS